MQVERKPQIPKVCEPADTTPIIDERFFVVVIRNQPHVEGGRVIDRHSRGVNTHTHTRRNCTIERRNYFGDGHIARCRKYGSQFN